MSAVLWNRRRLLQVLSGVGVGTVAFQRSLVAQVEANGAVTAEMVAQAEWIAGIELNEAQREEVASSIERNLRSAKRLREVPVDADTVPALVFRPDLFFGESVTQQASLIKPEIHVSWSAQQFQANSGDEDIAFAGVSAQASILAAGEISSRELTELYLQRLAKFDPLLHCVITQLDEHALNLADASDERRSRGRALGVLDGIPWVAKDLIAVPPWKTTWGAEPFRDQVRPDEATVSIKMREAGAVLLAKVSLGAMAWGDVWFDAITRNPWDPEEGSSGSSAGSASAVAAGLATFALGSETLGSIVSPTFRCRTSGLRPTFGRVSRAGCMPLAWSMDKIGPTARSVEDLAFVFASLLGTDGKDPSVVERPFRWPSSRAMESMTVGVPPGELSDLEQQAVDLLVNAGVKIQEVDLRSELPVRSMSFILGVEASTVFDDAFRSDPLADYGNWPSTFRESQFVTAIQYLRANRLRSKLITETETKLAKVDVMLGGEDLLLTNLTGHPSLVVACGSDKNAKGQLVPGVLKLTAASYREEELLHVGAFIQRSMPPAPNRPPLEDLLAAQQAAEVAPVESESANDQED